MAVYTDVGVEELQTFLAGYDLGDVLAYKGIAEGVENSNFLLHTTCGYFILTLYEKRVSAAGPAVFPRTDESPARASVSPVRSRCAIARVKPWVSLRGGRPPS